MQRYLLDIDDVLEQSLFTFANSTNVLNGLTAGANGTSLGVPAGGLGNVDFVPGQTIVFNGTAMVSSGAGPITLAPNYDDRYYTKTQIDAMFASLAIPGTYSVAYANIVGGIPALQMSFLQVADALSGPQFPTTTSSIAGSSTPTLYTPSWSLPAGVTLRGLLISVGATLSGPNNGFVTKFQVANNIGLTGLVDAGWFRASSGGDAVGGETFAVVPCDANGRFYWRLIGVSTGSGSWTEGGSVMTGATFAVSVVGYLGTTP